MSREHWDRVAPVFYVFLNGTASTSPNLAKEGARSVTISVLLCYIKTILTHWDCIYFTKFS